MEECRVSASSPMIPTSKTLSLTFFDVPWLYFISSPIQSLFFYTSPSSSSPLAVVDLLKRSLSLTLRHFHPLAGHLITLDHPFRIVYSPGDSVSFTVVSHSDADFDSLSADHPRDAHRFYPLLPRISSTRKGFLPLLAVRLTLFRDRGICIGLTCHHVAADSRTFNMFIKTWAFFSKHGGSLAVVQASPSSPFYDRSVIEDDNGLIYSTLLEQYLNQNQAAAPTSTAVTPTSDSDNDNKSKRMHLVRSTFLCSPTDMGLIKRRILALCLKNQQLPPSPLSPYVLVCAFVWTCLVKSSTTTATMANTVEEEEEEEPADDDDEPIFFGFNAGGITRLNFEVPQTYFGNCVAFGRSTITRHELMGDQAIVSAAKAIGSTIKRLDDRVLGGVQDWIKEWEPLVFSTPWEATGNHRHRRHPHIVVSGSPKVDLYATDFGWGKPSKIEDVSIDDHIILSNGRSEAISLTESRNVKGGIEVGLVLPKPQMDAFVSHFHLELGRA